MAVPSLERTRAADRDHLRGSAASAPGALAVIKDVVLLVERQFGVGQRGRGASGTPGGAAFDADSVCH